MRCSKCGAENPAGKKFCGDCGSSLNSADGTKAPKTTPARAALPEATLVKASEVIGERRRLTVLFCDLVGSTQIAAQLDPEEWRELAAHYQQIAAEAVARFDGHVAQYLGDGVLAFFGYPLAHEDDAERAVRAGLAIIEGVQASNAEPDTKHLATLAARVGIHAGPVVVGNSDIKSANVFGETPNVAARVQAAAQPDTVLISAAVQSLVAGLFVIEDCGEHRLKGVEQPVRLYRAIKPASMRHRTYGSPAHTLTPFVGRDEEIALLLSRWKDACEGQGQVVLITGEPGIGKSRLVERFRKRLDRQPHIWIELAGSSYFENTPFYAVTEMLAREFAEHGCESVEEKIAWLEQTLESPGTSLVEAVPLLAALMNLPATAKYAPPLVSSEQQRKRLLSTLATWLLGPAMPYLRVVLVEDLHWVDPSTMELLDILVERSATLPVLLLCTTRRDFRASWSKQPNHSQITLERLSNAETRALVTGVASGARLPNQVIQTVIDRTSGVPLFAEELIRLVLEGDRFSAARQIPATLHDSLMARLDRLGSAKEVAQLAAVIGREFSYRLLSTVATILEDELQLALGKLADAELIYARGSPPEATYLFKHALIRDAAYEALLRTRRRELHRSIAQAITEKFTELREANPEVLARHWAQAGEIEQAIREWGNAARVAESHNALTEAIESCQEALTLFDQLPESADRDLRELELRQSVVRMLQVTRGYAAPETIEAGERAGALAEKSGNLKKLISWITSRGYAAFNSGNVADAIALADQALGLALRAGSPSTLGFVYTLEVAGRYSLGDLAGAETHFAAGQECFDAPGLRRFPGGSVFVLATASCNAWTIGCPNLARERMARMLAASSNSPYDSVISGFMSAIVYGMLGENERAEDSAAHALEVSEKHQFLQLSATCRCVLGGARARLGRTAEGITLIQEGISGMHDAGSRGTVGDSLTLLAAAMADEGLIAEALETAERALQTNQIVYQPETLRLQGELRQKAGSIELAENDFRQSAALARRMGAKARELRAITSLARMLAKQGRGQEGYALLAEIYTWFTEGFDTADLKEAKAVLDELSISRS